MSAEAGPPTLLRFGFCLRLALLFQLLLASRQIALVFIWVHFPFLSSPLRILFPFFLLLASAHSFRKRRSDLHKREREREDGSREAFSPALPFRLPRRSVGRRKKGKRESRGTFFLPERKFQDGRRRKEKSARGRRINKMSD